MPTKNEILDAMRAQHNSIDILLAMLIMRDKEFMPSKSAAWPGLVTGNTMIKRLVTEEIT